MEKKTRNLYFIIAGVSVIVIALIIILTILMVSSSSPKQTIDALLTNLKAGDFEKTEQFITGGELLNTDQFNSESKKLLFEKLEWKIKNITTDENKATIELEITNKDFSTVITNYSQKVLKSVFAGEDVSSETFKNYLAEELKSEDVGTTTITATIKVVQEDKKWKVVADEELEEALLPGLQSALNSYTVQ